MVLFFKKEHLSFLAAAPLLTGYLRANQLGLETGVPSRAYFAAPAADPAAPFTVKNAAGQIVAQGTLGATTGTWGKFRIYPIDVTLSAPGSYTLAVAGAFPAQTTLQAGAPAVLYGAALGNALGFFQNERDGADYIPSALRTAPAHLNDARATVYATPPVKGGQVQGNLQPTGDVIDTSGGWWDAGDYLKFVETHSYTVAALLMGVRDFPAQMGQGGTADFTAEAKFGLHWLARMWNDQSRTLYYETGIGIDFHGQSLLSDHDLWRLPQTDDTAPGADAIYIRHRPVFAAGPAGAPISPNLAGRMAAALALGFLQYRATDLGFAQSCLIAAEHIFDLADTHPQQLLTALPYGFYPETEWRDDLEWGATELDLALALGGTALPAGLPHTDPGYYLSAAASWAHAYITGPGDAADTLNLYDASALAHFDLWRAIALAGKPGGLAVSQADLVADLGKQLGGAAKIAGADPFGFGFPWAAYDTTSHGAGLAVTASEYGWITGSTTWAGAGTGWMSNILGANIWGVSLLVGDGANFTDCLQHQVANIAGSLTGGSPVLAGGAVEGPNATGAVAHGFLSGMKKCPVDGIDRYKVFTGRGARFEDNVQNYANTEPAIDLTATSPLMFAWRIAMAPVPLH